LRKAAAGVCDAALRHRVENEVRAERELARRRKAQEWEAAKANKEALLAQLIAFEKMAKDLDRARSLRRFMEEIVASKAAPAELVGSLQLMALMADWLDPLVKARWPEVDSIGERNPHGGLL
jgi:ribosomal protein L17